MFEVSGKPGVSVFNAYRLTRASATCFELVLNPMSPIPLVKLRGWGRSLHGGGGGV